MNLSNDDVQDILRLLGTLPVGEFVLETSRFTLRLRRADGEVWAQELTVLTEPSVTSLPDTPAGPPAPVPAPAAPPAAGEPATGGLREVRAPLPGTFYRAPHPGAPPFVAVGAEVTEDTVVAIIETMKLMNPVHAGAPGTVAEICLADGEFAPQGTVLLRVSAQAG
ncbi:MAG TPA: biotin/lipoyl-containing protein [Streptosporangiaceae bacterium]